jgi:rhamnosyl/mannosyltransferase
VQVEAMAAGLPVVSTNLDSGVPWVNQDGVSGLIVRPADAGVLSAALNRLDADPDLRRRLAEGAAARARATFALDRMVATFKSVIEQAVRAPEALVDARPLGAGIS